MYQQFDSRYHNIGYYRTSFRFHAMQMLTAGAALIWALIANTGFLLADAMSWFVSRLVQRSVRFSRRDAGVMLMTAYWSFCMASSLFLLAAANGGIA